MNDEHVATPRLLKVAVGDMGPCQMRGCNERATALIEWTIGEYGETRAWYCDEHAPVEAIEAR